jgi:hypothetical protein
LNWPNRKSVPSPQAQAELNQKEEKLQEQRKQHVLLRIRGERRLQFRILDDIIVMLSRMRVVGNQTDVSDLATVLNLPASGLSEMLDVPLEAIFKARNGVELLRALKMISGRTRCGKIRTIIRKEIEDFEILLKRLACQ